MQEIEKQAGNIGRRNYEIHMEFMAWKKMNTNCLAWNYYLPDINDITPGNLKTRSRRKKDAMAKTNTTDMPIIARAMKARTERIQAGRKRKMLTSNKD